MFNTLTNMFRYKSNNPLVKRLKLILAILIFVNLIIIFLHFYSFKRNYDTYHNNLVNYGVSIINAFEGGHFNLLLKNGFSEIAIDHFFNELNKMDLLKNFIVYDDKKTILFALNDFEKSNLNTTPQDFQIFDKEDYLELILLHHTIHEEHIIFNNDNILKENIKKNIFISIFLDNTHLKKLASTLFFDLLQFLVLQLLVLLLYFYTIKVLNLHSISEQALTKTAHMAEIGKISTILAHEIKNPLSSVQGFLKYIHKKLTDEQSKSIMQKALEELQRLNKILNDFLAYGREIPLNKKDINIGSLLQTITQLTIQDCSRKEVSVNITGNDFNIYADESKMVQVLLNLLINAIQASPIKNSISISLIKEVKAITITNNIASEINIDKTKLFDPFYTTKEEGSGLGLAISKKIMDLHNFHIEILATNPFSIKLSFPNEVVR